MVLPGESAAPVFRPVLRRAFAHPGGWLNGMAGFLARGGILLFSLPIWVLPTPVGVSLLLGPVDVTGPPRGTTASVLVVAGAAGALLLVMAVTAAASDLAAHRRMFGPGDGTGWGGARLVAALVVIEAVVLLPSAAVAAVAAGRFIELGRQEYFLPSSLEVPFALRVVAGARTEVLALVACLVAADAAYAILSRSLLRRRATARAAGPAFATGARGRSVRAARAAGAWMSSWAVTAVFVLPGLLLVACAWAVVQEAVAGRGLSGSPAELVGALVAIVFFIACWGLAVAAGGAGSIVRSVLWNVALDRQARLR